MAKPPKSQWDFGELFSLEQTRSVLTVSELTAQIRRLLEKQMGRPWVTGEVTNLRSQPSGHIYFTLKDAGAQLSCVLFRGEPAVRREWLEDGRKLLLQGDVTVYEARGQYQLIVRAVEMQGVGALQLAFEKLKQKLQAEGWFAAERKRPLPRYPQRIGLVTSPAGAAIRDVLHVVRRRNPGLEIILAPCRVQGDGAAQEIASAIRMLNQFHARHLSNPALGLPIDLILVTRGGGSLEDLWAFNEEATARAIFESQIPVVSAIGHEIDFTISDFVADARAATPSVAAELITAGVFASCEFVSTAAIRLRQLARQQVKIKTVDAARLARRLALVHPRRRFNEWLQRLDDFRSSLSRCVRVGIQQNRLSSKNLCARLARLRPRQLLEQRRALLEQAAGRLREQARHRGRERRNALATLEARLKLLGPEQVLARGYSLTTDAATGKVIRSAAEVKAAQRLKTRLKTGVIFSQAEG